MSFRVIEDDGGDTVTNVLSRTLAEEDMIARLEKNIQKEKQITIAGNTNLSDNDDDIDNESDDKRKAKRQKMAKKKATSEKETDISYAPTIDEVTTNKDHLATLRGEGRYFGVTEPDANEPVCSNCHRRGHRRGQCKVVVCHACGKVDDHYETQCPNSMVCSNCGEKGHFRNTCPSKKHQTYCVECDSRSHVTERCPSIWRSYVLKPRSEKSKMAFPTGAIFCYNCSAKGHYGDDCPKMRISKTPNINGSAFSGENLPKELVGQYKNYQNSNRYDDDSFDPNNRKRTYDTANNTNYNHAPPPYPRFNNYSNGNNNNSYKNNNYRNNNNNNNGYPKGPTKVGYIPARPSSQNQRRNNFSNSSNKNIGSYSRNNNGNYGNNNNNNNNFNNYNSRSSYFNNNNNRNYGRNNNYSRY